MKKALLALAALVIIGGGVFYYVNSHKAAAVPVTNNAPLVAHAQPSLADLVSAGQPVTCTFSSTTPQGAMTGTIYVAGGMVAGDFSAPTPMGSTDAHMLIRDNVSYVWTSASNIGFKSTIGNEASSSPSQHGLEYTSHMDYQCLNWSVDASKFSLPGNVNFSATGSYTMPPQGAGATGAAAASGTPKGSAAMCAKCKALPSAQKAQCLAALQC